MAELQQFVEIHQTNGGFIPPSAEAQETSAAVSAGLSAGSKRRRRPSVRLGEIGGDEFQQAAYDSHSRRQKWRPGVNQSGMSSSRSQTLTNLSSSGNENPITVGTWRVNKWVKLSGGETEKRVRSTKIEEPREKIEQGDERFSEEEEEEDGFCDFSREESESPVKEQTETVENRRRYSEIREVELLRGRREGVRKWLKGLGLERYWPMFEIHEVDEQVLPLLTLEDLKDIGINAVGSRRKMFCSIQKLGSEFS